MQINARRKQEIQHSSVLGLKAIVMLINILHIITPLKCQQYDHYLTNTVTNIV